MVGLLEENNSDKKKAAFLSWLLKKDCLFFVCLGCRD